MSRLTINALLLLPALVILFLEQRKSERRKQDKSFLQVIDDFLPPPGQALSVCLSVGLSDSD